MKKINENSKYFEITTGGATIINEKSGANSKDVLTGSWRVNKPVFIKEKCTQCLLCFPVCPDSSIPVKNGKRGDFDYKHCKGCGICEKACKLGAIKMTEDK